MKVSDFVFVFPAGIDPRARGVCRVRTFVSSKGIVVLMTDLGVKNPGPSVTNAVEVIIEALRHGGMVAGDATFIEHYEDGVTRAPSYDLVRVLNDGHPQWESCLG